MRMFAENPEQHIADNSDAFEENFINILRLRLSIGLCRSDNQFYTVNSINNEIVRDKKAVRINSTRWPQIADFLKVLDRSKS